MLLYALEESSIVNFGNFLITGLYLVLSGLTETGYISSGTGGRWVNATVLFLLFPGQHSKISSSKVSLVMSFSCLPQHGSQQQIQESLSKTQATLSPMPNAQKSVGFKTRSTWTEVGQGVRTHKSKQRQAPNKTLCFSCSKTACLCAFLFLH